MKIIGLIGLGAMGGSYAKHLLASGYKVFVVDPVTNGSLPICTLSTGSVAHPAK